jgi:hypothetical protein
MIGPLPVPLACNTAAHGDAGAHDDGATLAVTCAGAVVVKLIWSVTPLGGQPLFPVTVNAAVPGLVVILLGTAVNVRFGGKVELLKVAF